MVRARNSSGPVSGRFWPPFVSTVKPGLGVPVGVGLTVGFGLIVGVGLGDGDFVGAGVGVANWGFPAL